jgi:hypothetical protein
VSYAVVEAFMAKHCYFLVPLIVATSVASASAAASHKAIIKNALSAAPKAVAKDAGVVDWDMKTLKEEKNGFTCLPDDPSTPTVNDPMCLDGNGMAWLHAFLQRKKPPATVGLGYMLQGGAVASTLDPYATAPDRGEWLEECPHIMIFAPGKMAVKRSLRGANPVSQANRENLANRANRENLANRGNRGNLASRASRASLGSSGTDSPTTSSVAR